MKHYEAEADIEAPPDAVWEVLADVGAYPSWDSGVQSVDGVAAQGARIKVVSEAGRGRAFPVTVTELNPGRGMVWSGGMPLGLFRGVRTFTLEPLDGGSRTRFRMREEYSGPLLAPIWRTMPDLGPSFTQFAEGLKARVEGR
jgi:hypothetical protein